MDQRATINVLTKALARLKMFYAPALLQDVPQRGRTDENGNTQGRALSAPPTKGEAYEKSGGAGGVVQLLMKIIEQGAVEEQELNQGEQRAQAIYAEFVQETKNSIEADRNSIETKTGQLLETRSARSETEGNQLSNDEFLAKQQDLLKAHRLDCDWLIKYFDIRQQARAEEMDVITDAK